MNKDRVEERLKLIRQLNNFDTEGLTLSEAIHRFDHEYEAMNKMRRDNSNELFMKYTCSNDHDADLDTNLTESELLTISNMISTVVSHDRLQISKEQFMKMMNDTWDNHHKHYSIDKE